MARWRISIRKTNTKLRGHVGRGYRAPSLYERFGSGFDSTFGYTTYGDPRLAPEHSISFDGGVDQTFAKGRVRASATLLLHQLAAGDRVRDADRAAGPVRPVPRILQFAGRDLARRRDQGRGGAARGFESFRQLHLRERGGAESVDPRHSAYAGDSAAPVFGGGDLARRETDAVDFRHPRRRETIWRRCSRIS